MALCGVTWGQEDATKKAAAVEEKLGEIVPLDLTFKDEEGKPVTLSSLVDRPTVLLLVYFRCPSICSPLMNEVATTVDEVDLMPGIDYNLLTVSFDDREGPELARTAKKNLLGRMEKKVPPVSWRFLTGDTENIAKLTDGVGFQFRREGEDYVHPATVMFLSKEGKIVRYLPGLKILPTHMKMALIDAAEGRPRSFMQRLERLCYSFDPEGKVYVLKVNRIILVVTLVALGLFLAYLLLFGRRKKTQSEEVKTG